MEQWLKANTDYLARKRGLVRNEGGVEVVNQSAVEGATKVPQTTVSGILAQGKAPRLTTLQRLADGLGVEVWQLLSPPSVFRASLTDDFPKIIQILCKE